METVRHKATILGLWLCKALPRGPCSPLPWAARALLMCRIIVGIAAGGRCSMSAVTGALVLLLVCGASMATVARRPRARASGFASFGNPEGARGTPPPDKIRDWLRRSVLYVGGNWNNSSNAGLWYFNGNNDSSNSNSNIGLRNLVKDIKLAQPLPHRLVKILPVRAWPSRKSNGLVGNKEVLCRNE